MLRRKIERKTHNASALRNPRFLPRLEALESRVTPSCAWDPVSKMLTGDADGDTAYLGYRVDGGGYDIWCNYFEFVDTIPEIDLTFNAAPGGAIFIDDVNANYSHIEMDPLLITRHSCIPDCAWHQLVFNGNVEHVYFA